MATNAHVSKSVTVIQNLQKSIGEIAVKHKKERTSQAEATALRAKSRATIVTPPKRLSQNEFHNIASNFKLNPEVESRIREARRGERIAFMSGKERGTYPQDRGYSKFAQVHGDPDLPKRRFLPPKSELLDKPISKKGYGIGGLSAPRFPRLSKQQQGLPGPGDYHQKDKGMHSGKEQSFAPHIWVAYGLLKQEDANKFRDNEEVIKKMTCLWNRCNQVRVGFGSCMKQARFGKERKWNCVGPGHYSLRSYKEPKVTVNNSFLRGPVKVNASTQLHCSYGAKEGCIECGRELMHATDYYRSRFKILLEPLKRIVRNRSTSVSRGDFVEDTTIDLTDPRRDSDAVTTPAMRVSKRKKRYLLCRTCYCKAGIGKSKFFRDKREVEFLFEKTRHCGFIHAHNGLPEHTEKASCKWTRRLTKKETCLNKHWIDRCPRRVIERK